MQPLRSRILSLEALESRRLMALSGQLITTISTKNTSPLELEPVDKNLFFVERYGVKDNQLWKSNGYAGGTVKVKSLYHASGYDAQVAELTNVAGTLYFTLNNVYGQELWKSDGTPGGTERIGNALGQAKNLTNVGGTLFFNGYAPLSYDQELWKSNGTSAGTVQVKDVNPGVLSSNPSDLTDVNGTLFFLAFHNDHGFELWKSDGTTSGTSRVKDIVPGPDSSTPSNLTNAGGVLFFSASTVSAGTELWRTNGFAGATTMVKNIAPGAMDATPLYLTNADGTLYFTANDGVHGEELWVSNGQAAGTHLVKEIYPGTSTGGNAAPAFLTAVGDKLFFRGNDGASSTGLWVSQGTSLTTQFIGGVAPGIFMGELTNADGQLFYVAQAEGVGRLFTSNGTAAGTKQISNKAIGPGRLTNVNGTLFFVASYAGHGDQLWKVVATNHPPILSLDSQGSYRENAAYTLISPHATVLDSDSSDFGGGILSLQITNPQSGDRLGIRDQGQAAGKIGLLGGLVTYGGKVIGSVAGSGPTLTVRLNNLVGVGVVTALLRSLTFSTSGDAPSIATRTITFQISDGDGASTPLIKLPMHVVAVNDAPTLQGSGSLSYPHDTASVLLAPSAIVTDVDSAIFAGGRVRVRIDSPSVANRLAIGGTFRVDSAGTVRMGNLAIGRQTSSGFGTKELIVTLNGNTTLEIVQQLIRSIAFKTVGGGAGQRKAIITVSDGSGGTSSELVRTVILL